MHRPRPSRGNEWLFDRNALLLAGDLALMYLVPNAFVLGAACISRVAHRRRQSF